MFDRGRADEIGISITYVIYIDVNITTGEHFYRIETNSTATNFTINIGDLGLHICSDSLKSLTFSVSALIDSVGEGERGNPVRISFNDPSLKSYCSGGKHVQIMVIM